LPDLIHMAGPPALEALGISKRYDDRDALRGVDLVAQPGELHGLLGPNGAGKTTLMRIVLGLVRPDAGAVRVLDTDLSSVAGGVPDGVAGFVETPAFYPYLSARKNLDLLARLDGRPRSERPIAVARALDEVGLGEHADITVRGYSAGMRQRLGLAAALLRAPRLLLLDEPTSSLDPAGARDVRGLARRLAGEGAAVVLSSHDMAEVEELCSTLTVIDRGQVVFSGSVAELRTLAPAAIHVLHTSDDGAALAAALLRPAIKASSVRDGLEVAAQIDELDEYIIALGQSGVAVRSLERRTRSLESLFLELTARGRRPESPAPHEGTAPETVSMSPVAS
jgi:ABC-2 type transport system ATP-binding protein